MPKHVTSFTTSEPVDHIGQTFSVDVLRRSKQLILVSRESVTSFTNTTFIKSEKAEHLLEGVIVLTSAIHPSDGPASIIRSDPAPGFQSLALTQPLKDKGLTFELGRIKNPNKNPVADKAIQELEDELVRLEPSGCPITVSQLTLATATLNSRIRLHGLSAYELMFRRNQFTATDLNNRAKDIIKAQHDSRLGGHLPSLKCQRPRRKDKLSSQSDPTVGCFVYLKNERSKHKARDRYLVVSHDGEWFTIRKFTPNGQLRGREYKVHTSECFSIVTQRREAMAAKVPDSSSDESTDPGTFPTTAAADPTDAPPDPDEAIDLYEPPPLAPCQGDTTIPDVLPHPGHPPDQDSHDQVPSSTLDVGSPTNTLPRRNPARRRDPPNYYGYVRGLASTQEGGREERAASGL